jgi:hypothetical protein
MREKLNSNPVAQVALLGVLALVVGFLLITRMGGSSDSTTASAPAPATATDATGTVVTPAAPATPVTPGSGVTPPPVADSNFKAGPGLPQDVVNAYDANKVVVLLVVNKGSVDDEKVKAIAARLHNRSDTALFTVESKDIAEYSRIAEGVDLQQTPALVVLRPKHLNKAAQPTASVEYGFRGPDSVDQAVEDALYKGRTDIPYYPN